MAPVYYIGVDIGTASVRAGLVDSCGKTITSAVKSITVFQSPPAYYEQSSDEIWQAICFTVQKVLQDAVIPASSINGIGFDATASMLALDENFTPVSVSPTGEKNQNVVMWLDHRATIQAKDIAATKHTMLKNVGDAVSPENNVPKLVWLKENLPDQCWRKVAYFLDLSDFVSWRATGSLDRSMATVITKWFYDHKGDDNHGWNDNFLHTIGIADLITDSYKKIGNKVMPPGEPCGKGLTKQSAEELGLMPGTAIGHSLIDALSGAVGCLSCHADLPGVTQEIPLCHKLAMICGSSTCHIAINERSIFVPGIFGPFYSIMLPNYWVHEAGQTAAGLLLDYIVQSHSAYDELKKMAESRNESVYVVLNTLLTSIVEKSPAILTMSQLTKDLHIWPDFHGNRSPLSDPFLTGMMSGLSLSSTLEDLAVMYLATLQALAYGTKLIISSLEKEGYKFEVIHMCGGLSQNEIYVQLHSDICNIPVVLPDETESVILGSAILGARASGDFASIKDAMLKMGGMGKVVMPITIDQEYHQKKYAVFMKMLNDQRDYKKMMQ